MKKELGIFLLISLLLFSAVSVSAINGRMGNLKMILYPEVNGWTTTTIEKTIHTENVNDVPINVELKLDASSDEIIELVDESYVLQPGEIKKAEFLVKVKKEGTYHARINVFFSPADPESKEPGVVLSSQITVVAAKDQGDDEDEEDDEIVDGGVITGDVIGGEDDKKGFGILLGTTAVLVIALIVLAYLYSKKKKKKVVKKRKVNAKKSVETE